MDFELRPVSDAGRIFVDLCESHQEVFSSRAAVHDRDGNFPTENFADLARSGVMVATVPAELGGLGVSDLRDQVVGINRLARGDGSRDRGKHISDVRGLSWTWREQAAAKPPDGCSGPHSQGVVDFRRWQRSGQPTASPNGRSHS